MRVKVIVCVCKRKWLLSCESDNLSVCERECFYIVRVGDSVKESACLIEFLCW